MKVIFLNLHANGALVKTMDQIITKKHPMAKEEANLRYLIHQGVEVMNLVTLDGSTCPFVSKIKSKWLRRLEAKFVLKKNGYNSQNVKVITQLSHR